MRNLNVTNGFIKLVWPQEIIQQGYQPDQFTTFFLSSKSEKIFSYIKSASGLRVGLVQQTVQIAVRYA
jgi:hypothetical protein